MSNHNQKDLYDEEVEAYFLKYQAENNKTYAKLNEMLSKKVIFTAETAKCSNCKQYTLVTGSKQARSADEAQDTFGTCSNPECKQKNTQKIA